MGALSHILCAGCFPTWTLIFTTIKNHHHSGQAHSHMPLVSSSGKAEAKSLWQPRPVRARFQNKAHHCPHFTDEIVLFVAAHGPSWLDPSILTVSLLHMIILGVAPTVHWRNDTSSNPQYRNQTSSVQTTQLYTQFVLLGTNHFHCQSSLSQGCCLKCSWGCFSSSPAVLCDGGKTHRPLLCRGHLHNVSI